MADDKDGNACCPHWYRGFDTVTCAECGKTYKPPKALSREELDEFLRRPDYGTSKG